MEKFTFRFSVLGIPVTIAPFFWLTMLFYGLYLSDRGRPLDLVFATLAIIAGSILVHELAHAIMYRAYDQQPQAMLHGLGGLTIGQRPLAASEQIVVSVAGPLAQLLLLGIPFFVLDRLYDGTGRIAFIINDVAWFNIVWPLINLLPALPLDGGHIAQSATVLVSGRPHRRRIHQISIAVGAIGVIYCFATNWTFGAFLFIFIIVMNAVAMSSPDVQFVEMGTAGSEYGGSGGYDLAPSPESKRRNRRNRRGFRGRGPGKPAELLAAGYDLLERHDPTGARERVAPLLSGKSKKADKTHAAVISAWAHLREGAPRMALSSLEGHDGDGVALARLVARRAGGDAQVAEIAQPLSSALANVQERRGARQGVEVLVRRGDAVAVAQELLGHMDLDGVLRLQQTLHDMGRRSVANEVSELLLADPDA